MCLHSGSWAPSCFSPSAWQRPKLQVSSRWQGTRSSYEIELQHFQLGCASLRCARVLNSSSGKASAKEPQVEMSKLHGIRVKLFAVCSIPGCSWARRVSRVTWLTLAGILIINTLIYQDGQPSPTGHRGAEQIRAGHTHMWANTMSESSMLR